MGAGAPAPVLACKSTLSEEVGRVGAFFRTLASPDGTCLKNKLHLIGSGLDVWRLAAYGDIAPFRNGDFLSDY